MSDRIQPSGIDLPPDFTEEEILLDFIFAPYFEE